MRVASHGVLSDGDTGPMEREQYLTFQLVGESYGVDILKVQEIKGWEPVREIPNTPGYIKGVLNLRGTLVPIIDLRERFELGIVEYTAVTVVIVLTVENDGDEHAMGIVADTVSDVIDVERSQIKNPPGLGSKIDTRYMKGMVVGEQIAVLLDVDNLLDPEQFAVIESIADHHDLRERFELGVVEYTEVTVVIVLTVENHANSEHL